MNNEDLVIGYFVDLEDVRDCIVKVFDSKNYLQVLDGKSEDFKLGAAFGMVQAYVTIASQCKKYELKENEHESKTDC